MIDSLMQITVQQQCTAVRVMKNCSLLHLTTSRHRVSQAAMKVKLLSLIPAIYRLTSYLENMGVTDWE